jgi:hypothetical protein
MIQSFRSGESPKVNFFSAMEKKNEQNNRR